MASAAETPARPMNREEYLDSLRDGREIWIYGEKVEDVTTHPAFRNGVRSVARLYDGAARPRDEGRADRADRHRQRRLHAPLSSRRRCRPRTSSAGATRSRPGSGMTYGWMGRSPDYKAAFLATYGPNADYYAPFADNARRWYKDAQEQVYFMNHTLVNPPVDRNKDIHEVDDIFIHAVKETDEGVVVTGAKMVATGSAFSNYNFVSYHGAMPIKKKEYALSFFAPDEPAGDEADLPSVVRVHGGDDRQPVRLPALEPLRRERRGARVRGRADPVGELPDLRQPRDREHLPPDRLHLAGAAPGLHAPGGQARLPRGPLHQDGRGDRDDRVPRHPGVDRRDPRVAQHVLVAHRRDVPQPGAVGRTDRCCRTSRPPRPTGCSRTRRTRRSRRSSRTRRAAR